MVVGPTGRRTQLLRLSVFEDVQGRHRVRKVARPSTVAFDPVKGRLAFLTKRALVPVAGGRKLRGAAARRASLAALGLRDPRAMAFERATRTWHILDAGARAIVRVAVQNGTLRPAGRAPLGAVGSGLLRGIAFNPADGLVYVLNAGQGVLVGLDRAGTVQRAYAVDDLELRDPTAIVIAPSADPTDASGTQHLYVADAGSRSERGAIVEAALEEPRRLAAAAAIEQVPVTVVQTIETFRFTPSSPDPAGITYIAADDRLFISDSEVNETPTYQGFNLFSATRAGTGEGMGTTVPAVKEPTGLGYDPADRTLYVSDDDADRVTLIKPGPDGRHGTSDDVRTFFSTSAFGSTDAESVEYDPVTGHVFICDGIALDVFQVNPVNGVFGDGDDVVSRYDIGQYGARDCEGMGIDPRRDTLLAVDPSSKRIYELSRSGALVRLIDASTIPTTNKALSGITVAPTSDPTDHPSATSYWVTDRQRDNGEDPNENDGLLYELSVPSDGTDPDVAVLAPADGTTVSGTVVVEAAAIGEVAFSHVEFRVGGVLIGTDANGADGWSTGWTTTAFPDGPHVVTATGIVPGGEPEEDAVTVTVDNTAPTVAVTAPTAGSTVTKTITLAATAADNASVVSVEFFADGTSVGVDTDGGNGWSVAWNTTTLPNGSHTVTAVARDAAGNAGAAPGVTVVVDNPSVVTLDVPIAVGADDADQLDTGAVRRLNGDLELGSDGGIPTIVGLRFLGLDVPGGATIEEAYVQFQADENGKTATSLAVQAERADNPAPFTTAAFNISSRPRTAAAVAWTPPQWVNVGAAGPDQRTPDIRSVVQEVVNRPGWAPGNALVVLVTGTGRRTPESFEGGAPPVLHVAYSTNTAPPPPDGPPQVAITSPAPGSILSGPVALAADASDERGVASVQFRVDGEDVGTDTNGADGWSLTWDAGSAGIGSHAITAVAADTTGNTTTSSAVPVIVDAPPAVAVTAPGAGATVSGAIQLAATATDDVGVTSVSFSVGGALIGTDVDGSDGWSLAWGSTQAADGPQTVTATATDTRGQTASDSRSITVDNFDAVPTVALTTPLDGALLARTVAVLAQAADDRGVTHVEFRADGTLLGTDTDGSDGWSVSWDTTAVADGPRTVMATAFDMRGQSASASAVVTIDNTAPSIAVTEPSAGATVSGSVAVTATASDGTVAASSDGPGDVGALDRFGRTVSSGSTWGTADVGGAWERVQGTKTGWEVTNGVARVTPGLAGATARLPVDLADVELLGRVRWTDQAAGGVFNAGSLLARVAADAGDLYQAIIRVSHTNQRVALQIRRHVGGASSQLGSDFVLVASDYTPGDWWWIRFQAIGTALKAKAWKYGDPEPGGWQLEVTDANHASGGIGYKYSSSSGNTVAPVVEFDDLTATEPSATPPGVGSVEFFADGASIGTDANGADGWSASWDTTSVPDGTHTLTAVARDAAGNVATSAPVAVVVDNPNLVSLAVPIGAGLDDADQLETGAIRRTNGDLELGSDGGIPTIVGLRFAGLTIPTGATIEEAYVQFQSDENGRDTSNLTVRAESADNAASFTTAAFNISSRPRTAASVAWSPPQWVTVPEAGPGQRTPNLRSVLQEVVDRPGWASGNALVVLVTGSGRRTPESFEGLAPPVLHVSYTASSTR